MFFKRRKLQLIAFLCLPGLLGSNGCGSSSEEGVDQQPAAQAATAPAQPAPPGQSAPAAGSAAPGQQPANPGQNPMAGLMGALGQMSGQPQGQTAPTSNAVAHIPWQTLSKALPSNPKGWSLQGEIEGESANIMGISVSQASCKFKQGEMKAKVQILDTSMNPLIAMPFNMARSVQLDSNEERMGPINFGTYPGTQKFNKKRNKAQVMIMVHNRIMITIEVDNAASEAEAVALGQQVNFAHLAQVAGG